MGGRGTSNGGAKTSMAPVSFHTLWQPAPPGTVRFFFSAGGSLALLPVNSFSQPGRKAVPGDLFSEAVFLELGWTSGTQLTGEGETTCTGEHSVGELL